MLEVNYSAAICRAGRGGALLIGLLLALLPPARGQQVARPQLQIAGILLKPNGAPLAHRRVQLGYYVSTDLVQLTDATGRFCFTAALDTIAQDSLVLYAFRLPKIGCYHQQAYQLVAVASCFNYVLRLRRETRHPRWQRRCLSRSIHW